VVLFPWDGWRDIQSTVLDMSLTAVQPLGHDIHNRAKILIRFPMSNTGDGDSMLLRNACTHIPLTRLHDVIRHVRSFAVDTMFKSCGNCLLLVLVQRGAEGHMYSTERQQPVGLVQDPSRGI